MAITDITEKQWGGRVSFYKKHVVQNKFSKQGCHRA